MERFKDYVRQAVVKMKPLPIKEVKSVKSPGETEPSGVYKHNDIVYVISDEGSIIVDGKEIMIDNKCDFEGITVNEDGTLFVVIESSNEIATLDKDYKIVDKNTVQPKYKGKSVFPAGDESGIEALTYFGKSKKGNDLFFVGNQSYHGKGTNKSSIALVNSNGKIKQYYKQKIKDIAGLCWTGGKLLCVSDTEQTLFVMDEQTNILERYSIPYANCEGVWCNGLDMILVQDSGVINTIKLSKDILK